MNREPRRWTSLPAPALSLALALALALGGCFSSTAIKAPAPPAVMPLTAENAALRRQAVARAKAAHAESIADKAGFIRMVRVVYVDSWKNGWSVPDTVALALERAKGGDPQAKAFLAVTVHDMRLCATLEGLVFTRDDWRDIHVRSGLTTAETFARFDQGGR